MEKNIDHIIISFLDGSISPSDKKELLLWLQASEANRTKFMEIKNIWNASQFINKKPDVEKAFEVFSERVEDYQSRKKFMTTRRIGYTLLGVASVFLLLIMLFPKEKRHIFEWNENDTVMMTEVIMPEGTKGSVMLPDSSVVWLNSGSKLEYPEKFDGKTRVVKMQGEAYFEVRRDESKPFIVELDAQKVEVLGTTFNVKNKTSDKNTEITLISGSVMVDFDLSGKKILLQPNERITYSKSSETLSVEKVDAELYKIWTKNRLSFDNANLAHVLSCLEKWYDITIEFPEDAGNVNGITLSVTKEPVEEVLGAISYIAPIKYNVQQPGTIGVKQKN